MKTKLITAFVLAAVIALAAACGNGQQRSSGPSSVAVRPSPTADPDIPQTDADAVRIVAELVAPSTGEHSIARMTAVQWVRTTIRGASTYFSQISPQTASGARPASTWDTTAWIFEFHGDFTTYNRLNPGKEPVGHTFYMILRPNEPGVYETEALPYDLAQLGTVHVLNRGDSPQIDALRAPDAPAATAQAEATSTTTPAEATAAPSAQPSP